MTLYMGLAIDRHPLVPTYREATPSTVRPTMSEIIKLCSETVVSSSTKNINT